MIVGYFSHEVRTPLNAAMMGIEVLKRDINKRRLCSIDDVADVENSCTMVVDILNDLVTYEQLDTVVDNLTLVSTQIRTLLDHKFTIFKSMAVSMNIEFEVTYTNRCIESAHFMVDEDKIKQVIRHILSSAINSAGENGKVQVGVDIISDRQYSTWQQDVLKIEVKDSGVAVAEVANE